MLWGNGMNQIAPSDTPAVRADVVANLHDAFLTASLLRKLMLQTALPPDLDPSKAHACDRFRLERLWVDKLYVLVEAWQRDSHNGVAELKVALRDKAPLVALDMALAAMSDSGLIEAMLETRHYMSHRDRREYWDVGRMGPLGHLTEYTQLTDLFGEVLLSALAQCQREAATSS